LGDERAPQASVAAIQIAPRRRDQIADIRIFIAAIDAEVLLHVGDAHRLGCRGYGQAVGHRARFSIDCLLPE